MKIVHFLTAVLLFTVPAGARLWAATPPPDRLNYQGVLRDGAGNPVNATVTMIFRLYDHPTDPADSHLLWEEAWNDIFFPPGVMVSKGLFTVGLGDPAHRNIGHPGLLSNFRDAFQNYQDVYLAVKVGTDAEMSPRIKVISAGYAINAGSLDGLDSTSFAAASHLHGDADISDAITASNYLPLAGGTMAGNIAFSGAQMVDGVDLSSAASAWNGHMAATSNAHGLTYTAEGTGGGLDSDALDGQHASAFADGYSLDAVDGSPVNAVYVDAGGNVGVGTQSPSGLFDVYAYSWVGRILDQSVIAAGTSNVYTSFWQSFTAGKTGPLERLDIDYMDTPWDINASLKIYDGAGTGGALLTTQSIIIHEAESFASYYLSTPPAVTSGNTYTFEVICNSGSITVSHSASSVYPGGTMNGIVANDVTFRTYVYTSEPGSSWMVSPLGRVGIGTTSPTYRFQLGYDSAAKPSTNTWAIYSDKRLKKDISPFTDGLDVIEKIHPVRYRYNGLMQLPQDEENIGVVAQDIQPVAPYTIRPFKAKLNERDAQETDLLGFNSHALTFVMINAIKELDARTAALVGEHYPAIEKLKPNPAAESRRDPSTDHPISSDSASKPPQIVPQDLALFQAKEAVEPGDVLVLNPANGDELYKCFLPADSMVVGIAAESAPAHGEVRVIQYSTTWVKVDATTAPIARGDLLVASTTLGHAMKAARPIEPGTVIGKALEPLQVGTGLIKVLVMLR